ncbi:MAG: methylmalonyl Co-A mutase-associated GTPase MeaB [Chitinophagaceae bacterium]|jgi:LAO/AO transport system kinase|nr:methylmalonyl Co-A mutase-associated GTPase MeaB [Chitinophagaceae bacterium]
MWKEFLQKIQAGDAKALARSISLIENEYTGYQQLLTLLPGSKKINIIGITGPPGSGKSTLTDALIECITKRNEKVGVLCVDPSSPFNLGSVLGDRIRMSAWYNHPSVFIRSLATRGSMGGLHPKIIEIADLMKAFPFDHIIIETVGVGQSEIEIAGLADTTVVVLVPEAGDDIQTMKAGLMEIADIFVVNKADRPGADEFVKNLRMMMAPEFHHQQNTIPVLKTVASQKTGVEDLYTAIVQHASTTVINNRKYWLLAEKAWHLIQHKRMMDISKTEIKLELEKASIEPGFNFYRFIDRY